MNFDTLNGPALVARYNEAAAALGETPVKRFADRATALKRTAAILARLPQPTPAQEAPAKTRPTSADPFHVANRKARGEEVTDLMFAVLDALRAAASKDGAVDPKAVRPKFAGIGSKVWAGTLRGLSLRGLYSKGRVVMKGNGEYRRPGVLTKS